MSFLQVQGQDYFLAGSGIDNSQTTIPLASMTFPNGDTVLTADIGEIGYATIEPETEFEENISFTGITQNGDGTAELTGVTRGLDFASPFTSVADLKLPHAGGLILRMSNSASFYTEFSIKRNNETITGVKTFDNSSVPRLSSSGSYIAGTELFLTTKEYVDGVALSGAPNASTTQKGIVEIATQAEVDAKTSTGGTGAILVTSPEQMRSTKYIDGLISAVGTDSYAATPTPQVSSLIDSLVVVLEADVANTGAATFALGATAAKTIKKYGNKDLDTNDFIAGGKYILGYDLSSDVWMLLGAISKQQMSQNSSEVFASTSTGNDSYVVTTTPSFTPTTDGVTIRVKLDVANTGAATINVNGSGALSIVKGVSTALVTGDLLANEIITLTFNSTGTVWVLNTPPASSVNGSDDGFNHFHLFTNGQFTRDLTAASGAVTVAHGLGRTPKRVRTWGGVLADSGTSNISWTDGVFGNGTTSCTFFYHNNAGNSVVANDNANAVRIQMAIGDRQTAVVTVDATNITYTYTKTGVPTGTATLSFEVS